MSFLDSVGSILNTSVFKEKTYSDTISDDGPYQITLADNLDNSLFVKGVVKGGINFSIDSTWSDMSLGNIVNNFSSLEKIMNIVNFPLAAAGVSYDNAGVMTEKFFSKGGYLEIEPVFDVVNWNGDGMPLKVAVFLLNYCVPKYLDEYTVTDVIEGFIPFLEKFKAIDKFGILESAQGVGTAVIGSIKQVVKDSYGNAEGKGIIPDAFDSIETGTGVIMNDKSVYKTQAPGTLDVKISNYFNMPNMVVESLSVEFSDKITDTGPIKAEFKVRLSTKSMPTTSDMGLYINKSRVTFAGGLNSTGK
jgi:hypothetical protein